MYKVQLFNGAESRIVFIYNLSDIHEDKFDILTGSGFDPVDFRISAKDDFCNNFKVVGVFPTKRDEEHEVRICLERVRRIPGAPNNNVAERELRESWELFVRKFYDAVDEIWRKQNTNLTYMTMQKFCEQFGKPGMLAAHGNRYISIGSKDGKVFAGKLQEFLKSRSRYIGGVRETARIERIYPENAVALVTDPTKPIVMWVR